jgi:hypothetical protein
MDDCTLTDAIARVAYNREYDGRYNGPPNVAWTEANARALRARDKRYPSNSGLPGTTVLVGLKDETVFAAALQEWKEADRKKWGDAETVLRTELLAGDIRAFDEFGNAVPPEFWLANHLRSRRILLLLRASDIEHLIERQARRIQNEIEEARERMIARFAEKQRRLRDWISFADVADWCARESGSVRPDSRLKEDAYRQLSEALARGDFELYQSALTLTLRGSESLGSSIR